MAGANFKMDWGGLDRMVGSAMGKAARTKSVMSELGETMVSSTVERFESSTAPDGTPWKPSKRAENEGGKTLVDKAVLVGSIGYEASSHDVLWGSSDVRARIHQEGGKTGRGHAVEMPARPFVGISEDDIKEARAILADHLKNVLGRR